MLPRPRASAGVSTRSVLLPVLLACVPVMLCSGCAAVLATILVLTDDHYNFSGDRAIGLSEEGSFVVAALDRADEPGPPWLGAGLPTSYEAFVGDWRAGGYLPASVLNDRLCAGDAGSMAMYLDALTSAWSARPRDTPVSTLVGLGQLMLTCDEDRQCPVLVSSLDTETRPVAQEMLYVGLLQCPSSDASVMAAFDRADAPALEVILFHDSQNLFAAAPIPWTSRYTEVVRQALAGDDLRLASVAQLSLGERDGPEATALLLDAHAAATDPQQKREIALAMEAQSDPRAAAIFRAACAEEDAPACIRSRRTVPTSMIPAPAMLPAGESAPPSGYDCIDPEGSSIWHDSLLRRWAPLAGDALAGVEFGQLGPTAYDSTGTYTLEAWMDGSRFTTPARYHGDWRDVPAVVGMLNGLLKARGRGERYGVLYPSDNDACVTVVQATKSD